NSGLAELGRVALRTLPDQINEFLPCWDQLSHRITPAQPPGRGMVLEWCFPQGHPKSDVWELIAWARDIVGSLPLVGPQDILAEVFVGIEDYVIRYADAGVALLLRRILSASAIRDEFNHYVWVFAE